MDLLVKTASGFEDALAAELKERFGLQPKEIFPGKVIVGGSLQDAIKLVFFSAVASRVYAGVFRKNFSYPEDLKEILEEVLHITGNLGRKINSFGVKAKRISIDFISSPELAAEAGRIVQKATSWKVDLTAPDIWIYVELNRNSAFAGIDLAGKSLHMRGYRVFQHPAPIQPIIPSALFFIAGKDNRQRIFDPFCGGGTFVIEDLLLAAGRGKIWRNFELEKFPELEKFLSKLKKISDRPIEGFSIGGDSVASFVEGARKNAASAGVDPFAEFFVHDARHEAAYRKASDAEIKWIFTNPPYGGRLKYRAGLQRLYEAFLKHAINYGFKGMFITGFNLKIPQDLKDHVTLNRTVKYGGKTAKVFEIKT